MDSGENALHTVSYLFEDYVFFQHSAVRIDVVFVLLALSCCAGSVSDDTLLFSSWRHVAPR